MDKNSLKQRAKQLKADIPVLFLALKHPRTPVMAKILAACTVCLALSPIDLIPDFIPVLGYLDDIIILPALIALTVKLIPKDVFEECRVKCENASSKAKKWYYGIPVVIIWGIIVWVIVKAIWF